MIGVNSLRRITAPRLIFIVALFWMLLANAALISNIVRVYPPDQGNLLFLAGLFLVFLTANVLLLSLICWPWVQKPLLVILLVLSAAAAYFMDTYNVIIDQTMLLNAVSTDRAEAGDLLSAVFFGYLLLLGLLPALWVSWVNIPWRGLWPELKGRLLLLGPLLLASAAVIGLQSDYYASFAREHKALRFYANPTYYLYSLEKFVAGASDANLGPVAAVGEDAHIPEIDIDRELIIVVVGETARADRFSLNGYGRETNPELKKQDVVSFTNVWSCGTSTAVSVPCMFSLATAKDYSNKDIKTRENLLDVLTHADVNVVWLDNNSDSKGVAVRSEYRNFRSREVNPVCDSECRDTGMLTAIADYVEQHPEGDILIVLHSMGNHGPAYYKRYPSDFETFTPVCRTNQLEDCSQTEIDNAYDNAIRYTDHFLSETIELLKEFDDRFETAMLYVSDHGESLGEYGTYLHGLPMMVAPDVQKHVPMVLWLGKHFDISQEGRASLAAARNLSLSHDNLFHTVLGLMEIQSEVYDPALDLLNISGGRPANFRYDKDHDQP